MPWVAACALYDRQKLLAVGGFSFWKRLPRYHSGEEVLVQNLLMRRWGACAILAGFILSPIFHVGTINDAITLPTMLVTLLGAIILLAIWNAIRGRGRSRM